MTCKALVIDYQEVVVEKGFEFEFSTCNRLPYVCNRLPATKLLKFKFKSHDPSNHNCEIDYTNVVIDY